MQNASPDACSPSSRRVASHPPGPPSQFSCLSSARTVSAGYGSVRLEHSSAKQAAQPRGSRQKSTLRRSCSPAAGPTDSELRPWESALSGAVAGAAFNLALFPADTVKSTMQTAEELRRLRWTRFRCSPRQRLVERSLLCIARRESGGCTRAVELQWRGVYPAVRLFS